VGLKERVQGRHDQIKFKFVGMFRSHPLILPSSHPLVQSFRIPNTTNEPTFEVPSITIKHRQESNPKSTDSRDKKCQTNASALTHHPSHTLAPISPIKKPSSSPNCSLSHPHPHPRTHVITLIARISQSSGHDKTPPSSSPPPYPPEPSPANP
jgi:hypothetical protein